MDNEKRRMLFTIQWHITSLCPNRCKHCYIDDKIDDSVTFEQFQSAYNRICAFEKECNICINNYNITGGDPLLNPHIRKILSLLAEDGREITILGTPESLSETNIAMLKAYGIRHYQLSLDGMEGTHDKIRGQGSFQRTLCAVQRLTKNQIWPSIMYTVNSLNYHELVPLIKYLDEQKLTVSLTYDFMVGYFNHNFDMPNMLQPNEAEQVVRDYDNICNLLEHNNSTVKLLRKCPFNKLIAGLSERRINRHIENFPFCDGCACGLYQLAILPNGDAYPCRRLPIKVGNIYSDTFYEIFQNNETMKQLRDSKSYTYCCDCMYFNVCRGCPAVSFFLCNDPFAQNPYCIYKEVVPTPHDTICQTIDDIMQCEPNLKMNMRKEDYWLRLVKIYQKIATQ